MSVRRDPARVPRWICLPLAWTASLESRFWAMGTLRTSPFSDTEIQFLDEFLMSDTTPEDVLSIDELHGYLTAIVLPPSPGDAERLAQRVSRWGRGPQFESTEQAQEIMSLIMRMHNDIADALRVGEEFGPPMLENTLESGEDRRRRPRLVLGLHEGMRSQFDAWEFPLRHDQRAGRSDCSAGSTGRRRIRSCRNCSTIRRRSRS